MLRTAGGNVGYMPLKGEVGAFVGAFQSKLAGALHICRQFEPFPNVVPFRTLFPIQTLVASGVMTVDVSEGVSRLLAVQTPEELELTRKAATFTAVMMHKTCLRSVLNIIENDEKKTHAVIAQDIEDKIIKGKTKKIELEEGNVDSCYPPIIQSGRSTDRCCSSRAPTRASPALLTAPPSLG